jgi:hypothetical protein
MNPIKSKHIVIGLAAGFILFMFCRIGNEDYSYARPGTQTQIPIQSQPTYRSFESEQGNSSSSTWSNNPTSVNRHEVLQTKVKGYREETFWGEEHPTHEKVRHMDDDEFDRFIDEVELKDADVYWGATEYPPIIWTAS